jgi:hypothetical protein
VTNLLAPFENVNLKHRNDDGYLKMDAYSRIGLLADLSRIKHTCYTLLDDSVWNVELFLMYYGLAMRIANLFSLP